MDRIMEAEGLKTFFNDQRNMTLVPWMCRENLLTDENRDHPMRVRIGRFGATADNLPDILYDKTLTEEEKVQKLEETVEWLYAELAELWRLTGYTGDKKVTEEKTPEGEDEEKDEA